MTGKYVYCIEMYVINNKPAKMKNNARVCMSDALNVQIVINNELWILFW